MAQDSKIILRIHFGLLLAELICIPAFAFELYRALGGNELSWAYVFEWPLLGGYAVYMWKKMLKEERGPVTPRPPVRPAVDDPRLAEWNAYLASVHRNDQPAAPDKRVD